MPTTADTTVIVDALDATYSCLHEAFQKLPFSSTHDSRAAV